MGASCFSCHRILDKGGTTFPCPGCTTVKIVRCKHCRETGVRYTCTGCGFSGPN